MIYLFRPYIDEDDIQAVTEVLKSRWLGLGPKTKEFEEAFSAYINMPYAVGLNSCTAALEIAIRLYNIGPGDEVIVPTLTFVSTAHAVATNGAIPVFCDIDPESLLIDFDSVRRNLSDKTKAIIVVHYGGRCVDIEELRKIVGAIPIIEDCAHASGSVLGKQMAGSLGDISCFSFQAVKNICAGDGGMVLLRDKEQYLRAKKLRWLGINKGTWDRNTNNHSYLWEYNVEEIGYKNHMNDISAALGLSQLKKISFTNTIRRNIQLFYRENLRELDIKFPPMDQEGNLSSWHIFYIRVPKEHRNSLLSYLADNGISGGVHYKPIHLYDCYHSQAKLSVAEEVWQELVSLPCHPDLTFVELLKICETIKQYYEHHA